MQDQHRATRNISFYNSTGNLFTLVYIKFPHPEEYFPLHLQVSTPLSGSTESAGIDSNRSPSRHLHARLLQCSTIEHNAVPMCNVSANVNVSTFRIEFCRGFCVRVCVCVEKTSIELI